MKMYRIRRSALTALAGASLACGAIGGVTMALASTAQSAAVRYKVVQKTFSVSPGRAKVVDVKCPVGMKPAGGGAHYGINGWPGSGNGSLIGISESGLDVS